ncbi:hypothetical protein LA324_05230 [Corynebacterium coyleae]|uniref:hypothetical protein n=1 Tax=Corynebacterium coyleae TaxID=53374 RepID=UPI001CC9C51D|nr:hypothetical protein [Corynebacterium coyleae]UBI10013.1 hypothetical protein LA324_05230 [Corynebacterium coyleae]
MNAKQRLEGIVRLIGGNPSTITRDYNGALQYRETYGELDILITDSDSYDHPWVDIYHFQVGPVALYRVSDDEKAAQLINEYKEIFDDSETAGDDQRAG